MNRFRTALMVLAALAVAIVVTGCDDRPITGTFAPPNTVTASGMGEVSAAPDLAVMSFGVTRTDKDAAVALKKASTAAERVNTALKKLGVDEKDLQTGDVSIYPTYSESGGKSRIDGYQASVRVTAKVRDLEKLGAIITALADAGATDISGPSFTIDEDSKYRGEAIAKAVEDARAQAAEMAKAAGKKVGEVISITNTEVQQPVPLMQSARAAMDSALAKEVPIETGTLDVTANVTVVFALD